MLSPVNAFVHLIKGRPEFLIHLGFGEAAGHVRVAGLTFVNVTGALRYQAGAGLGIIVNLTGVGVL